MKNDGGFSTPTTIGLALILALATAAEAQITSQLREISADGLYIDPVFFEPIAGQGLESETAADTFDEEVDIDLADPSFAVRAVARQTSDVDAGDSTFEASGLAVASLYVQGDADAFAESRVTIDFTLVGPGVVYLDGELVTDDVFEFTSHDPGNATSFTEVRIEDVVNLTVPYLVRVDLGDPDQDLDIGDVVALPAGEYRLVIEAEAMDMTGGVGAIHGSVALASFFIDGTIICGSGPVPVWRNLAQGLPGATTPMLFGCGDLLGGTIMSIVLKDAPPATTAALAFGVTTLNAPFKGGTLVPNVTPPGFFVPLVTDGAGELALGAAWPPGVPPGFEFFFQYWLIDGSGPAGFTASNAIRGKTP